MKVEPFQVTEHYKDLAQLVLDSRETFVRHENGVSSATKLLRQQLRAIEQKAKELRKATYGKHN